MFTLPSSRWDCITMRDFAARDGEDRKSTRLNSSHSQISYAVFCLKKKNTVLVEPRLDHGAEEQLADVFRLDVRPADRLPHREGAQPGRRHVRERALEPADRGPRRARDDDLGPRRHIPATSERLISNCWRGATDPWRNRSRSMITML